MGHQPLLDDPAELDLNHAEQDEDPTNQDEDQAKIDNCRCEIEEERVFKECAEDGELEMGKAKDALGELHFHFKDEEWNNLSALCDFDNNRRINRPEFEFIVRHLLVEEANDFAKKAMKQIAALRASLRNYESAKREADKLRKVWKGLGPRKFLRWLRAMDAPGTREDRNQLLRSLVFTVPLPTLGAWQAGIGDRQHISFGKLYGNRMVHDNVIVRESDVEFPLPQQKPGTKDLEQVQSLDFRRSGPIVRVENYLLGNEEAEYHLGYTSVALLSPEYLPYIVHTLENATVDSKVFTTPIVNAILNVGWIRASRVLYVNILLDLIVIILLSRFAIDARNRLMPCQSIFFLLTILSAYHFVSDVLEFSVPLCMPGRHYRMSKKEACVFANTSMFGSFWSFFEVLMSTYFFVIMLGGLVVHWSLITHASPFETVREKWFHNHPIWVVALLTFKATHLIIKIMCVRALGQRVIPAYYAMTHSSSKAFLLLLLLMFFDAVLAFHALPIRIYSPDGDDKTRWDPLENVFDLLVLYFHTAILGESAPEELEQEEKTMNLTKVNGSFTGTFSAPSTHTRYHHGVQVLNVGFIILIHIALLNVYISVLGDQYNKAVRKDREHFEKFRAVFTRKMVMRCFWCMRRQKQKEHVWIAYKKSTFPDPDSESQSFVSIQDMREFFRERFPEQDESQLMDGLRRFVQQADPSSPRER